MFYFTPAHPGFYTPQPSYAHPAYPTFQQPPATASQHPHTNAREAYLTALAGLKAAEAQYLATDNFQREEEALRNRLQEIEYARRSPSVATPIPSYPSTASQIPATSPYAPVTDSQDSLALLRKQIAEEQEEASKLAARIQAERLAIAKQREQDERRVLELKRAEQARQVAQLREEYEALQRQRYQHQQPASQHQEPVRHVQRPVQPIQHVASTPPEEEPDTSLPLREPSIYDFVEALLRQAPPAQEQVRPPSTAPERARRREVVASQTPALKAPKPVHQSRKHIPAETAEERKTESLADFLKSLAPPSVPTPPSTSNHATSSTEASRPSPKSPEASLKEQLEKRLHQGESPEIRDTVQTLLSSLFGIPMPTEVPPAHEGTAAHASPQEAKPQAEAEEKVPTEQDIADALQNVCNIETAFTSLESSFTLPDSLDFVLPESPALADSESFGDRLTYSDQNQSVRRYEQSLSRFIAQLDGIDSLGHEELRRHRKEVVSRVEQALEKLEKDIEERWHARFNQEQNKPQVPQVPKDADTTPAQEVADVPVSATAPESVEIADEHSVSSRNSSETVPVTEEDNLSIINASTDAVKGETVVIDLPTKVSTEPSLQQTPEIPADPAASADSQIPELSSNEGEKVPTVKKASVRDADSHDSDWSEA